MSVRLSALVLGVVALLATAALTYAADKQITSTPRATPQVKAVPLTLTVPDVTRQAYVFAKGILVDAGFAWKVQGGVRGFSANTVLSQRPAAGTRVLDTGAPTIMLTLSRNGKYGQKGTPAVRVLEFQARCLRDRTGLTALRAASGRTCPWRA